MQYENITVMWNNELRAFTIDFYHRQRLKGAGGGDQLKIFKGFP